MEEAAAGIECGTLILFGGGLAMGGDISQVFLAVLCVLALLLSKLTSHTAATNIIEPFDNDSCFSRLKSRASIGRHCAFRVIGIYVAGIDAAQCNRLFVGLRADNQDD